MRASNKAPKDPPEPSTEPARGGYHDKGRNAPLTSCDLFATKKDEIDGFSRTSPKELFHLKRAAKAFIHLHARLPSHSRCDPSLTINQHTHLSLEIVLSTATTVSVSTRLFSRRFRLRLREPQEAPLSFLHGEDRTPRGSDGTSDGTRFGR